MSFTHGDEPGSVHGDEPADRGGAADDALPLPRSPAEEVEDERTARRTARERSREGGGRNMLPGRERRRFGIERIVVRLIATCGIVGIGVALGAILVSSKVQGWITGMGVAIVSVVLAALLWSSRQV